MQNRHSLIDLFRPIDRLSGNYPENGVLSGLATNQELSAGKVVSAVIHLRLIGAFSELGTGVTGKTGNDPPGPPESLNLGQFPPPKVGAGNMPKSRFQGDSSDHEMPLLSALGWFHRFINCSVHGLLASYLAGIRHD